MSSLVSVLNYTFPIVNNWRGVDDEEQEDCNRQVLHDDQRAQVGGSRPLMVEPVRFRFFVAARQFSRFCLIVHGDDEEEPDKGDEVAGDLVFQTAVSLSARGKKVAFLTKTRPEMMPRHIHGMPKFDLSTAAKLNFIYPRNLEELLQYTKALQGIQNKHDIPHCLIVHGLHEFDGFLPRSESLLKSYENSTMTQTFTVLKKFNEAAISLKEDKDCFVVVTSRLPQTSLSDVRLFMWANEIWHLEQVKDRTTWCLKQLPAPPRDILKIQFESCPNMYKIQYLKKITYKKIGL